MIASLLFSAALAITNGTIDNDTHPYVGCWAGPNNRGQAYCHSSLELVSPLIVLTAAHSSWSGKDERVVVSFNPVQHNTPEWPGIYYQRRDHGGEKYGLVGGMLYCFKHDASGRCATNDSDDLAVIVLDVRQGWRMYGMPKIAPLNYTTRLHSGARLTSVGFGVTDVHIGANEGATTRHYGVSTLRSVGNTIKTGGPSIACNDDSGGGLYDGDVLIGILTEADDRCASDNIWVRLDTIDKLAFLRFFGVVP